MNERAKTIVDIQEAINKMRAIIASVLAGCTMKCLKQRWCGCVGWVDESVEFVFCYGYGMLIFLNGVWIEASESDCFSVVGLQQDCVIFTIISTIYGWCGVCGQRGECECKVVRERIVTCGGEVK